MLVCPPVLRITPLLAWMFKRLAFVRRGDSQNSSGKLLLPDEACHAVFQENLHAQFFRAGFERAHQRRAVSSRRGVRAHLSRPDHGLRALHILRAAVRSAGRSIGELNAVRQQKIKCRHAFVAEGAHDFPVAEAVIVPIHQVLEHMVGRIFDAVFFLQARAAAKRDVAAAFDRVPANVVVLLDHDHGGALLGGGNRGGKSRGAGPDYDYVGDEIPVPIELRGPHFFRADAAERGRAEAGGCLLDKSSARQCRIFRVVLFHALALLCKANS